MLQDWDFCNKCVGSADGSVVSDHSSKQVEDKLSNIAVAVEDISKRLGDLEARSCVSGDSGSLSFSEVIKKTIREVKKSEEPVTSVTDHGRTRVIKNTEVLVLKPKCSGGASALPSSVSVDGLNNVLRSIPVKSCRETSQGNVVLRFPHGEAKSRAKALVASSSNFTDVDVSEPKKMLPKMTLLDVPTLLPDEEIIPSIREKNPNITDLLDAGHTLSLVFSRVRDGKRMAVLKMSPEIRNIISGTGNRVFLGLTSCRIFDRFWATQCRHCQKFGHTKDRCPTKSAPPVCCFCSGPHTSTDCPDKSILKCINCSSGGGPADSCQHSASSLDCPIMISERSKVMENTDFGPSKN